MKRLITRSDFDGLVCAVILKDLGLIEDIVFVHPKDMQDGKIAVGPGDITTNLPYVEGAYLAFDHHLSETIRNEPASNHIINPNCPSAARVVYEYYGGKERLPNISQEMMEAVDKADAAQFSPDEILHPTGWVLLNYIMDARTGLGRFRNFTISNYSLMMKLIDHCKTMGIEEILKLPDVVERTNIYFEHEQKAKEQILRCTTVHKNLGILNLLDEPTIWATNRFMIYALLPQINISIHKMWGLQKQKIVFATGKSILDRNSKTNVGELMLAYEGGGHQAAGTCQVEPSEAGRVEAELIAQITQDG